MSDFRKIFKKIDGWNVIKLYARNHVLLYTCMQVLLCGFSKKSLEIVRLSVQNKLYMKLYRKNRSFIDKWMSDFRDKTYQRQPSKTVWTIWLQGMDAAPEIVRICYESKKKYLGDRKIIVITEENYSQYISFSPAIIKKYKDGVIGAAHFADLIRLKLLTEYGGTWMDATVLCTSDPYKNRQEYMFDSELFMFQTLKPGADGHRIVISSWFISAYSNSPILMLTRDLMEHYWETMEYAIDYFFIHFLYQMAIERFPEEWNKVVPVSNEIPHIILLRLDKEFDQTVWEEIIKNSCVHKLTHKLSDEIVASPDTSYYRYITQLSQQIFPNRACINAA